MPIVISEFEIVPEPAPAIAAPPSTQTAATTNRPPAPHDVSLALHHEWRRALRVKAD